MVKLEDTVFCDGCGVEILLAPVIIKLHDRLEYCCEDCAQGYECKCGERIEIDELGQLDLGTTSAVVTELDEPKVRRAIGD